MLHRASYYRAGRDRAGFTPASEAAARRDRSRRHTHETVAGRFVPANASPGPSSGSSLWKIGRVQAVAVARRAFGRTVARRWLAVVVVVVVVFPQGNLAEARVRTDTRRGLRGTDHGDGSARVRSRRCRAQRQVTLVRLFVCTLARSFIGLFVRSFALNRAEQSSAALLSFGLLCFALRCVALRCCAASPVGALRLCAVWRRSGGEGWRVPRDAGSQSAAHIAGARHMAVRRLRQPQSQYVAVSRSGNTSERVVARACLRKERPR